MRIRYLGWAGVEIESDRGSVVIDPLSDASAVFSALGDALDPSVLPPLSAPARLGEASAGLITHLHRDHADAAALAAALAPGAPVLRPRPAGGGQTENAGVAQAERELASTALEIQVVDPWETIDVERFSFSSLPAADGVGDPQLSWVVETGGKRVIHLGDTMFHGWWWRSALRNGPFDVALVPVNGAVLQFPHRLPVSPLAAVMTPDQAATAAEILGAPLVIPIHFGAYAIEPYYQPVRGAERAFVETARGRPYETMVLAPGETVEL